MGKLYESITGHGVPVMQFVGHRDLIERWSVKKGPNGLAEYRTAKNGASIDGITGYKELESL
jgi:hypothetical protein